MKQYYSTNGMVELWVKGGKSLEYKSHKSLIDSRLQACFCQNMWFYIGSN